jgi:predicted nucleic acid-binding protein
VSRLYLDASCIIYLIESENPFHDKVASRLDRYRSNPEASLMTSRLSRLECRTCPLRDGDARLLATYDAFFSAARLTLGEVDAAVIERATALRAQYGFRTPDAIHLATAIEGRADLVLTGDTTFSRCKEVAVEVLEA